MKKSKDDIIDWIAVIILGGLVYLWVILTGKGE